MTGPMAKAVALPAAKAMIGRIDAGLARSIAADRIEDAATVITHLASSAKDRNHLMFYRHLNDFLVDVPRLTSPIGVYDLPSAAEILGKVAGQTMHAAGMRRFAEDVPTLATQVLLAHANASARTGAAQMLMGGKKAPDFAELTRELRMWADEFTAAAASLRAAV